MSVEANVFIVGAHLFRLVISADIFAFLGCDCLEKMVGAGMVMEICLKWFWGGHGCGTSKFFCLFEV